VRIFRDFKPRIMRGKFALSHNTKRFNLGLIGDSELVRWLIQGVVPVGFLWVRVGDY